MTDRIVTLAVVLAAVPAFAAGCGSRSPRVADVPATPTTTTVTTTGGTTPTVSDSGSANGVGGQAGSDGGRGTQPFGMMVGDAQQGRLFSACIRRHGERSFPDPDDQGGLFVSGIDRNSPVFRAALRTCRQLLPGDFGQAPTPAQLAEVQRQLLSFSTCMRAQGIGDFPDPSGGALPHIEPTGDLDPNSSSFQTAYAACKSLLPTGLPSKALGGLGP